MLCIKNLLREAMAYRIFFLDLLICVYVCTYACILLLSLLFDNRMRTRVKKAGDENEEESKGVLMYIRGVRW